jgi:anti-anti-sigma regulatory factor
MKPGNWESVLSLLVKSEPVLKITTQIDVTRTTIELDGKLAGPWVELLKEWWRKTAGGNGPVTVLLCDVTFVDEQGKSLLADMYRHGAELEGDGCMTGAIVDEIKRGGRP